MKNISILEKTKDYVIVKLPSKLFRVIEKQTRLFKSFDIIEELSEAEALKILQTGMAEYRAGKTKVLNSLHSLRYGD